MRRTRMLLVTVSTIGLAVGLTAPAATQAPSPSLTVSAPEGTQAGPPTLTWTAVDDPLALGGGVLLDIATTPAGGFVAVGGGPVKAVASADGRAWAEAGLAVDRQSDVIEGIAALGDGLVAVGYRSAGKTKGRVWLSPDGVHWADPSTIGKVELTDVLAIADELVAVGLAPSKKQQRILTVWRSPDGEAWARQDIGPVGSVVALHEIARSPSGVWLIMGDARDGKRTVSRLWRSEDGKTWEALDMPDPVAGRRLTPPRDLIATPDGFLLAGAPTDKRDSGVLWYSPDGLAWELVATERSPISALASGPSGSYAFTFPVGTKKGKVDPLVVLWSSDGRAWCRSEEEAFDGGGVTAATVAPDGRLLAIGGKDLGLPPPPLAWLGAPEPGAAATSCTPATIDG